MVAIELSEAFGRVELLVWESVTLATLTPDSLKDGWRLAHTLCCDWLVLSFGGILWIHGMRIRVCKLRKVFLDWNVCRSGFKKERERKYIYKALAHSEENIQHKTQSPFNIYFRYLQFKIKINHFFNSPLPDFQLQIKTFPTQLQTHIHKMPSRPTILFVLSSSSQGWYLVCLFFPFPVPHNWQPKARIRTPLRSPLALRRPRHRITTGRSNNPRSRFHWTL